MENQDVLKFKDYTRLNNHYLKICLTEECLSLIGFNTEILDNNLYQLAITSEEIKKNERLKKFSLAQLFDKIIELIEKKKYQMTGDKNCIILSIFEGENFDINKDLQFVMFKTNDDQSGTYENGMKRIIKSLKRENTDIKTELEELKLDKKALSEGVNEKFSKTVVKNKKDNILHKKYYPKNNTDIHEEASKKKKIRMQIIQKKLIKIIRRKKLLG